MGHDRRITILWNSKSREEISDSGFGEGVSKKFKDRRVSVRGYRFGRTSLELPINHVN